MGANPGPSQPRGALRLNAPPAGCGVAGRRDLRVTRKARRHQHRVQATVAWTPCDADDSAREERKARARLRPSRNRVLLTLSRSQAFRRQNHASSPSCGRWPWSPQPFRSRPRPTVRLVSRAGLLIGACDKFATVPAGTADRERSPPIACRPMRNSPAARRSIPAGTTAHNLRGSWSRSSPQPTRRSRSPCLSQRPRRGRRGEEYGFERESRVPIRKRVVHNPEAAASAPPGSRRSTGHPAVQPGGLLDELPRVGSSVRGRRSAAPSSSSFTQPRVLSQDASFLRTHGSGAQKPIVAWRALVSWKPQGSAGTTTAACKKSWTPSSPGLFGMAPVTAAGPRRR